MLTDLRANLTRNLTTPLCISHIVHVIDNGVAINHASIPRHNSKKDKQHASTIHLPSQIHQQKATNCNITAYIILFPTSAEALSKPVSKQSFAASSQWGKIFRLALGVKIRKPRIEHLVLTKRKLLISTLSLYCGKTIRFTSSLASSIWACYCSLRLIW